MTAPTVRTLAKTLRLSRTTVAAALQGSPRVKAQTARRVQAAAAAAGYRMNPLASAVMAGIRRSRGPSFRGSLAAVTVDEPGRPALALRFFAALARGAADRAAELGFGLRTFAVGPRRLSLRRLDALLRARGIRGVILLPTLGEPDFSAFDWSRYAGVYADFLIERPALDAVCSDHHRSIVGALHRLHALGYRRPGLFLNQHHAARLHHHWEGAFLAFQRHRDDVRPVPPLLGETFSGAAFAAWFRRHRPDVVLGHDSEAMAWMAACGARIPETHGFFCLNLLMQEKRCAGLDQQPQLLGGHAAEIVIAQLHRNECGIPAHPMLTSIPARWVDGPSLRAGAASAAVRPGDAAPPERSGRGSAGRARAGLALRPLARQAGAAAAPATFR